MRIKGQEWLFLLGSLSFYIFFQSKSIFGADAGDLVANAATLGFPHPPGFPLYTLLASLLIHVSSIVTPAWRVALISSTAASLTLFFLYKTFLLFNQKYKFLPILGLIFVGTTYLFWQYSVVAEVFSLNSLFIVLVLYYFWSYIYKKKNKYLYLSLFFFGLGLAHHQTIVLILPGIIYLLIVYKKKFSLINLLILGIGFIPYLILFLIANYSSPASWFEEKNLLNLPGLFLRSEYGTFRASANIGDAFITRIFQIFSYFYLIFEDFWVAIPLIALGAINQYKKNKHLFYSLLLIFFTGGPLFSFYSSFLTVNSFMVGTYERFLLFSYPLLAIWFIWGIGNLCEIFTKRSDRNKAIYFTGIVLLIMIFLNLKKNVALFLTLRNDRTADNVAFDLLDSIQENGIFIVKDDIAIFNSEYASYVLNYKKVTIMPYMTIGKSSFRSFLKAKHPNVIIPQEATSEIDFLEKFIKANSDRIPIYTNFALKPEGLYWVPNGLLWRVYANEDKIPDNEEILNINKKLWENYHNPLSGVLKTKRVLMMDQIIDIYTEGRRNNSWAFMKSGFNKDSLDSLQAAWELRPGNDKTKLLFVNNYLNINDCRQANNWFSTINYSNIVVSENEELYDSIKNQLNVKCVIK